MDVVALVHESLRRIGVPEQPSGGGLVVRTPLTGEELIRLETATPAEADRAVTRATDAFDEWRHVPPPIRGEVVRLLAERLRAHKSDLAALVTCESGKIPSEAEGEVQEMIDICDFAVGLSRQLYGKTIASERPSHRMMETWHPLGPCAVITSFNFPVAVWAWNTAIALVCGNPVLWKPSERAPLCALASAALLAESVAEVGDAPTDLCQVVLGDRQVSERLVANRDVALVSATGSTRMGREVAPVVAGRFGRAILELGGNNAMVVAPSADIELAVRAIVFAAAGTAGQRCTTLRRLIVHETVRDELIERVCAAYRTLPIGNPLEAPDVLVGPLIGPDAYDAMRHALTQADAEGGDLLAGGARVLAEHWPEAYYVEPAILAVSHQTELVRTETFAPILYVLSYRDFADAIALHNDVPQGLASSIFTTDLREAEHFLGPNGSDCGIVNVNIGPSGAEIGGAFGGEKDTGGGRESGSDAWKSYMRRATNTINYSSELPLAQGVRFS